MLTGKQIAVIRGGESDEREVSLKTGAAVVEALKKKGHDPVVIDPAEVSLLQVIAEEDIDLVFVSVHGRFGEAGTIQGLLEIANIPYTGSGVLGCALSMDKELSKTVFLQNDLPTPDFLTYNKQEFTTKLRSIRQQIKSELGYPVVVKPANDGSSIGVELVKAESDLESALAAGFANRDKMMIEEYISGREVSVGILGNESPQVFPVVEVKTEREVYDYESKYTKGMSELIVPAPLDEKLYKQVQNLALKAHNTLNCRGITRVDLLLSPEGKPYVLEVNTVPGMTETSLVPKAAKAAGIEFADLIVEILKLAVKE